MAFYAHRRVFGAIKGQLRLPLFHQTSLRLCSSEEKYARFVARKSFKFNLVSQNGVLTACPSLTVCSSRGCSQRLSKYPSLTTMIDIELPMTVFSLLLWIVGYCAQWTCGVHECLLGGFARCWAFCPAGYKVHCIPEKVHAN
ncbi:hypothetical protein CRG98_017825 [Punica granatum]|uniref:Uncharacterized protein n=1 Tax=Punica granatum TaxID=22663 RepID=A0A2I0JZP7_PUNGR|nr:hypothetical protein CRG98_017825 [Punica granatum]